MPPESVPERKPTLREVLDRLIIELSETRDYVLIDEVSFDTARYQLRRLLEEALDVVNNTEHKEPPYIVEDALREAEMLLETDETDL